MPDMESTATPHLLRYSESKHRSASACLRLLLSSTQTTYPMSWPYLKSMWSGYPHTATRKQLFSEMQVEWSCRRHASCHSKPHYITLHRWIIHYTVLHVSVHSYVHAHLLRLHAHYTHLKPTHCFMYSFLLEYGYCEHFNIDFNFIKVIDKFHIGKIFFLYAIISSQSLLTRSNLLMATLLHSLINMFSLQTDTKLMFICGFLFSVKDSCKPISLYIKLWLFSFSEQWVLSFIWPFKIRIKICSWCEQLIIKKYKF